MPGTSTLAVVASEGCASCIDAILHEDVEVRRLLEVGGYLLSVWDHREDEEPVWDLRFSEVQLKDDAHIVDLALRRPGSWTPLAQRAQRVLEHRRAALEERCAPERLRAEITAECTLTTGITSPEERLVVVARQVFEKRLSLVAEAFSVARGPHWEVLRIPLSVAAEIEGQVGVLESMETGVDPEVLEAAVVLLDPEGAFPTFTEALLGAAAL